MVSSPKRRQSIGVVQSPSRHKSKHRRRAHSIAPGEKRIRRSLLAPRKSILKLPNDNSSTDPDDPSNDDAENSASRKSLARRVSFAESVVVRMIARPNTSGASGASPTPSPEQPKDTAARPPTNENDYPGAKPRRSSMRASFASTQGGEASMNLTGVYSRQPGSNWDDETEDDRGDDEFDMEDTEDLALSIHQRQSIAPPQLEHPPDLSQQTESSNASYSSLNSSTEHIEYTIPITRSLRPPAHEDPQWMALRAMTDSGNEPYIPPPDESFEGDMPLEEAIQRLSQAGPSFRASGERGAFDDEEPIEDSFTSSEGGSFGADGNETVNLSKMFGKPLARSSLAFPDRSDSTMDVTQALGRGPFGRPSIAPNEHLNSTMDVTQAVGRENPFSRPSTAPSERVNSTMDITQILAANGDQTSDSILPETLPQATRPEPVFSQPSNVPSSPFTFTLPKPSLPPPPSPLTKPTPFSFTARPSSKPSPKPPAKNPPSPTKSRPTFTAAFAPPVVKPSPRKSISTTNENNPNKRPSPDSDTPDVPNKRRAVESQDLDKNKKPSPVKSISPRKIAPFQPTSNITNTKDTTNNTARRSSLRRPSGYLARRKSVSFGLLEPPDDEDVSEKPQRAGRASVGASGSIAWQRPSNTTTAPATSIPSPSSPGSEVDDTEAVAPIDDELASETSTPSIPQTIAPRQRPSYVPDLTTRQLSTLHEESVEMREDDDGFEQEGAQQDDQGQDDITGRWVENVQEQKEFADDYNTPPISITQFFEMTGIKFMDEITAPRRSSIHPSSTIKPRPRLSQDSAGEIPLSAYFTALAVDIPQLSLYMRVSAELRDWIENSKEEFLAADDEAVQMPPELFREYTMADEDGRSELAHQLTLIRHNMRGKARAEWYDWKAQWIQGLYETAAEYFGYLEADATILEKVNSEALALLPERRAEYEQVKEELQKEQDEIAEIEKCDQNFLNDLKASIADAESEVEALRGEATEKASQLEWLEQRLAQFDAENEQLSSVVNETKRIFQLQQDGSREQFYKLKTELDILEDLNQLHVVQTKSDLFEYHYASKFRVMVPCKQFIPQVSDIKLNRLQSARLRFKDPYPHLNDHFLKAARDSVSQTKNLTCPQIVRCIADYWSSVVQIRTQLKFLRSKFPLNIELGTTPGDFKAVAKVLFPSIKAKAVVTFHFSPETVLHWPTTVSDVECDVKLVYGAISQEAILDAISGRMTQATPGDNHLYLLDACLSAVEPYI